MSAARALGFIYLVMASVFGVAIALHQHPALRTSASEFGAASLKLAGNYVVRPAASAGYHGLQYANAHLVRPAASAGYRELARAFDSLDPPLRLAKAQVKPTAHIAFVHPRPTPRRETELARLTPPPVPREIPPRPENIVPTSPELAAPVLPEIKPVPSEDQVASNVVAPPMLAKRPSLGPQVAVEAPAPLPDAGSEPIAPQELTRVVARLKSNLTPELLQNFALFLYVSKAEHGPWAQHMYVFAKQNDGGLDLKYNWLVSTGREKMELNDRGRRMGTDTPPGYYQLDPQRIYRHYTSAEWHQPMPYAMFFNWIHDGQQTGLAVHSTAGKDEAAVLGERASAGCIRLSPADASTLFALIRSEYKGLAPRFAVDRRTGTMSNEGILMHDPHGNVKLAEGYRVLIFIENYGGNDNVVAALF